MTNTQNGNVFIYILIAVVLFGALAFAISKSASQGDPESDLSDGRLEIAVNEIIAYNASVGNTVSQMITAGVTADDIDLMLPSDTDFNTAPNIYKIFHPDGGGLSLKPLPSNVVKDDGAGLSPGYYVGRFQVAWTPTSANDLVFIAYEITEAACEALNLKVKDDATIATISGASFQDIVDDAINDNGTNGSVYAMTCPTCIESPECVTDGAGKYMFYSIVDAQ